MIDSSEGGYMGNDDINIPPHQFTAEELGKSMNELILSWNLLNDEFLHKDNAATDYIDILIMHGQKINILCRMCLSLVSHLVAQDGGIIKNDRYGLEKELGINFLSPEEERKRFGEQNED